VARPEHLLAKDHVADEPVFLLHCEEAAQVALGRWNSTSVSTCW
jgi:hypothetical protein